MKKQWLLASLLLVYLNSFGQRYNLDFEIIKNKRPKSWILNTTKAFKVAIDSTIVYSGNRSISFENIDSIANRE